MRYLTIPSDIPSADLPVGNDAFSFYGFIVNYAVPSLPRKSGSDLKKLAILAALFTDVKAGDVVELTDDQHTALQVSLPDIRGTLFLRMIAFYTAVATATEKAAGNTEDDDG